MTTQTIRFAILGCGRMGRHHGRLLLEHGAEITALLDPLPAMARSLQQELCPTARIADSLEALVAMEAIDAAIICTPTAAHHEQALACLDRGWHVLCEKPLASNRGQIVDLVERADRATRAGRVFSLGYQRRHAALYRTLRQQVQSGAWGRVQSIVSHNVENWQPTIAGTWRDDPQQNPGGFLTDAGSHKLDMIFYTTGLAPANVFARSGTCGSRVEIVTSVSAVLGNDVLTTIDFIGNAQYLGEDLCLHCEHADLMIRHGELAVARGGAPERLAVTEPESTPVQSFLNSIRTGAAEISPAAAALPVYDMTQAILESARTGRSIPVDGNLA